MFQKEINCEKDILNYNGLEIRFFCMNLVLFSSVPLHLFAQRFYLYLWIQSKYWCALGSFVHQLDQLVIAARDAGALGAKLSGGGRGGNMIALATAENTPNVSLAIRSSGAINTITTQVNT